MRLVSDGRISTRAALPDKRQARPGGSPTIAVEMGTRSDGRSIVILHPIADTRQATRTVFESVIPGQTPGRHPRGLRYPAGGAVASVLPPCPGPSLRGVGSAGRHGEGLEMWMAVNCALGTGPVLAPTRTTTH